VEYVCCSGICVLQWHMCVAVEYVCCSGICVLQWHMQMSRITCANHNRPV